MTNYQSEAALEKKLIAQLIEAEFELIKINDESDLLVNLRRQIDKNNNIALTDKEFYMVLNYLSKGNGFDKSIVLREKMHLVRENGKSVYLDFFNSKDWCQNIFQVSSQINNEGTFKNRYDVTILVNGLPLVQIELKRRGLELKEAFNQISRYQRHSFAGGSGLFQFIQIFVISNGVNTKYYANNSKLGFQFTNYWTDEQNNRIAKLEEFTKTFLSKCHIGKMIAHYTVLTTQKESVLLRPYQYYAAEAILDTVKNTNHGGYIWHTTGSGKTLTSFKTSQILLQSPEITKVVFVVDRNDLDTQTIREFNQYKEGSVDTTENTSGLVKQFNDDTRLIVTTIQKLNNAISNPKHLIEMKNIKDSRIVFIFDECHRSQFGETHKKITNYFTNYQLFGFTGTPIFKENASSNTLGTRTTKMLFGDCLHRYIITDAINDENVLKFSVEYVGNYSKKDSVNNIDINVEAIDIPEILESEMRLSKITDYIISNHSRKTHAQDFNAMMCVSDVDLLIKYYNIFAKKKAEGQHKLKIATIFSYSPNEDNKNAGLLDEEIDPSIQNLTSHSRDALEGFISDYNKMFGTNFTTKNSTGFYDYYRDIASRVKKREIDILLVVNMFLTGFDSRYLNTLYVDKNLRYHGLIQAYSRTNRILNDLKSHGNVISFRNLKKATDDAVALFSNKDALEIIFDEPYEKYIDEINQAIDNLKIIAPSPSSVDSMTRETDQLDFVKQFRIVIRLKNSAQSFADFAFADLKITAQEFEDYKSKYLDIYQKVKNDNAIEKVSILEDVDFELELIRRDEISVDYIVMLLQKLIDTSKESKAQIAAKITQHLNSDIKLRSKRELIEKFISSHIPNITDSSIVETEFNTFWDKSRDQELDKMCLEEGLDKSSVQKVIDSYVFTGRVIKDDDIQRTVIKKSSVLERESILAKVGGRLKKFINTFFDGDL